MFRVGILLQGLTVQVWPRGYRMWPLEGPLSTVDSTPGMKNPLSWRVVSNMELPLTLW